MTIHDRVAAARQRLRDAGIPPDEADLDARLLAEHVLGWTTERFFAEADRAAGDVFSARFDALVERRASREPFAYIVGHQEFWGLEFEVTPSVLIPRPETELLVEAAIALCPDPETPVEIADVCTGSGCVAVAIACERPRARIVATDLSPAALEVARRNAAHHGVVRRIEFVRADLLDGVDQRFDVVVANPPYVAERDRAATQVEVVKHEPAVALFAGEDGLDVIRRLVPASVDALRPGATLLFEFGFGQDMDIVDLIANTPELTFVDLRADLQGIPRVAIARRR